MCIRDRYQRRVHGEYEKRLQELERERTQIEEDKAQVDRYKQLLLKQRDIMIALTTRLNERDETIVQLQEELEAYDRIHRETEEMLDVKKTRVAQLEGYIKSKGLSVLKDMIYQENGEQGGKKEQMQQYGNQNMVMYQDTETYNVTSENLQMAEEKIAQLSNLADQQQNEIIMLRSQIEDLQSRKKGGDMQSDQQQYQELVLEFESQSQNYLRRIQSLESKEAELKDQLRQKQEEVHISSGVDQKLIQMQLQLKDCVDKIIGSLSQQTNPNQLQNVARDLLGLQKMVSGFNITGNGASNGATAFTNISNTYQQQQPNNTTPRAQNKVLSHYSNQNSQNNSNRSMRYEEQLDSSSNISKNENRVFLQQGNNILTKSPISYKQSIKQDGSHTKVRTPMTVEEMLRQKRQDQHKKQI
eukprot:TRINITY_DN1682_c0_g1_i2.p1 TRINITY_DN1682_c0_g1~~TRINITY_DN1682_c0_g1_i2.p1  ORF type:complete len:414 (-),score=60.42 TRINITY_DN1682_c0_g1_i2:143-1384(-)